MYDFGLWGLGSIPRQDIGAKHCFQLLHWVPNVNYPPDGFGAHRTFVESKLIFEAESKNGGGICGRGSL